MRNQRCHNQRDRRIFMRRGDFRVSGFFCFWMRVECRVNAWFRVFFRVSGPGACCLPGRPGDRIHNSEKMAARLGQKGGDQAAIGAGRRWGCKSRAWGDSWLWFRCRLYRSDFNELLSVRRVLFPYHYPVCPVQGRPILVGFYLVVIIFIRVHDNLVSDLYNSSILGICYRTLKL